MIDNIVPTHVGFIMDGNGRWAEKRGKSRNYGHQKGAEVLDELISYAFGRGIKVVSFYAFSTENWSRPKKETDKLLSLMFIMLDKFLPKLVKNHVRLIVSGDLSVLSEKRRKKVEADVLKTADYTDKILNICFNYGSRAEIVNAANRAIASGLKSVDEKTLASFLYTEMLPDVDLVIRTSGEQRLSNFLLWQSAYAELYFTEVLWPDFSPAELDKAIASFVSRNRRFGGIDSKQEE